MLYDVNFIIGLLVTLVLVTIVAFYFSQRIEDQNEKISAVSVVVQAIAGELNDLKRNQFVSVPLMTPIAVEDPLVEERLVNDPLVDETIELTQFSNITLIDVSDDEDDQSTHTKSIHIGGSIYGGDAIKLKESIDLDTESEESESEESETDSESESSDSESDDDVDDLELDETHLEFEMDPVEEDVGVATFDPLSIKMEEEEEDICSTINILEELDDLEDDNKSLALDDNIFKTIHISLEEEPIDYKKMSLQKLRSVAVEKQLCQDASKLKKNELFKLLQVEP